MTMDISQREAEETMRAMAKVEGVQPSKDLLPVSAC